MTYIDGLRDAATLCAQRSSDHSSNVRKLKTRTEKEACSRDAFEALECALAIRRFAKEAERASEIQS